MSNELTVVPPELKPGTLCYIKAPANHPQSDLSNKFYVLHKRVIVETSKLPAWEVRPSVKSGDKYFKQIVEKYLIPVHEPTKDDVKDTLEVLAMMNNKDFEALLRIAKGVTINHWPDYKGDE